MVNILQVRLQFVGKSILFLSTTNQPRHAEECRTVQTEVGRRFNTKMKQDSSQVIVPAPLIDYSLFSDLQCSIRITYCRVRTRHFRSTIASEIVDNYSYVNKEIFKHQSSRKILSTNNPNRDCNKFFSTITKLFTYFHDFIKIQRLTFLNNFTQIIDTILHYKILKLNMTIYRMFSKNSK